MQTATRQLCPLCHDQEINEYYHEKCRDYFQCKKCCLIFVSPKYILSKAEQVKEYNNHQNSPKDMKYRNFLNQLFAPINNKINPKSIGLDFGSGPGPTLSVMFEEAGHTMSIYDHIYAPDQSVLKQTYDFVTASEVVEHLENPRDTLNRVWQCVKPGGYLGIMTKLFSDGQDFSKWYYKNEMTHICFFYKESFQWLSNLWKAKLEFADLNVMVFQKNKSTTQIS